MLVSWAIKFPDGKITIYKFVVQKWVRPIKNGVVEKVCFSAGRCSDGMVRGC